MLSVVYSRDLASFAEAGPKLVGRVKAIHALTPPAGETLGLAMRFPRLYIGTSGSCLASTFLPPHATDCPRQLVQSPDNSSADEAGRLPGHTCCGMFSAMAHDVL